ncbi:precorrin-3B synthase [Devosia sp. MSA67]|uniref:Precorrin-3B synthase n=2 Tax=Devosia sediminis TaxID=2798801 RepID=A0A934IYI6_9HYPH|nr:precorrin-3B synthase [Devosia sediminis]
MTSALTSAPASTIAAIATRSARRGACPTLAEPMPTGDGLLARIRVAGRALTPRQVLELARLAAQYGNGLVEITARGNVQVRGLRPDTNSTFAAAVEKLISIETGLVIDISPITGIDPKELCDPRPIASAIAAGARAFEDKLGPKVSVVVDGCGQISLAALKADIRLAATRMRHWAVQFGGGKPQLMDADAAVAATLAVLGALAAIGPECRATDLFPQNSHEPHAATKHRDGDHYDVAGGHTTALALPFGSARSKDLLALAEAAEIFGVTTFRLAPDHVLLMDNAPAELIARAATLGFIISADDPRRRVSACIGMEGCSSGFIAARAVAEKLAGHVGPRHLHVSGCSKGCAHPRPAAVTVVGRPDGIGLVIGGRAGDTPHKILDEAGLTDVLVHLQVPDDAI